MDWLIGTREGDRSTGQLPGKLAFATVMLGVVMATAGPVLADRQEEIISELEAEGYTDITTSKTWLRRTRIVAQGEEGEREIVLDPRNDEVLRDYVRPPREGQRGGPGGRPAPDGRPRPDGPPPGAPGEGRGPGGPAGDPPDRPSGPSDHGLGGSRGGEAFR
ncbi:hypothetical protein SAMN05877809_103220 [Rhodobacter sp. JA431]|uniref:hypothetical protein n=1 Tax=Rhodobacter sp. JA431 TaxID=570013 RepID=UPI000BCBE859|nr:hypothetical protein [Rhodobacter sp. JA431]SOC04596.1 hypothetical protein SAMN05877809_103220 [Rhodobacter sp. JA431]